MIPKVQNHFRFLETTQANDTHLPPQESYKTLSPVSLKLIRQGDLKGSVEHFLRKETVTLVYTALSHW